MPVSLLAIAVVGYILGTSLAGLVVVYRSALARRGASLLFVLTSLVHLSAIVALGVTERRVPLLNLGEFLLMLGWAVLTLHLWVWFRLRVDVAGLVLPPIAGLASVVALPLLGASPPVAATTPRGAWFLFHISVSTLGVAILCVAFAMSVIYILQDRALKSHQTLWLLQRLPALERCDHVGFQALVIGFLLLTLGIGTGVAINADLYNRLWMADSKQIFPLLAWVVFATILAARTLLGFRGRKSAYLTIAGFCLVMFTMLGINL
jgi:ABC-type uncharacterized transport system permease subunit